MSNTGENVRDEVLRWCKYDHTWIDQGNGKVSPSWGYGGTMMPVDDPLLCPEPLRDERGRMTCPSCERKHFRGSCRDYPWQRPDCENPDPPPACLKPALGGNRWADRDLPFDGSDWCAWWVRKDGPWRLTFHQANAGGGRWTSVYKCWDVATAESMLVDRTWQVRRARVEEYPDYLRERWWRGRGGQLVGKWRTPAPAG
jgi:hypothetical protein